MIQRRQTTGIGLREFSNHPNRTDQQTWEWLRLVRDQRWSTRQKLQLLSHFDTPSRVYQCSAEQLAGFLNGKVGSDQSNICEAEIAGDMQWLAQPEHALISIYDSQYPALLKEIHDPPIALFAKGDWTCLEDPKVAMVGSRRPSPVGSKLTRAMAHGLAELGVVVTSGMALGIDGAAHQGALEAGAPTIAVMGCGLDTIYPSRHRSLFEQISTSGCLLSEYPLGYPPSKFHFPMRNRIVSGLSLGVVIVEAAERSGTLVTARLATEQNRELMVVPGSALSLQYTGSHRLMKQGAAIVTSVEDIVDVLSVPLAAILSGLHKGLGATSATPSESPLLALIGYESTSVDEIILASGLTTAEVSSMLLMLEVEGLIAIADDGGYIRLC